MGRRINRTALGLSELRSKRYFNLEHHTEAEIPKQGILFSNHETLIDPVLITVALHDLWREEGKHFVAKEHIPHFLAKKELQETILKPIYDSTEVIYVNRDGSSKEEFEQYIKETNTFMQHAHIGFFYPGTRSNLLRDGAFVADREQAEGGIFAILNRCEAAREEPVPFIPVSVAVDPRYENKTKSRIRDFAEIVGYMTGLKSVIRPKPKAIIAFGNPVYEPFPIGKKRRRELTDHLVEAVHELRRTYQ